MSERVCVICDSKFESKHSRQKCCGDMCSKRNELNKKRTLRAKAKDANCIICGSKIKYGRASSVTCSEECSKRRKDYTKRQLGIDPPEDLVSEFTALRLLNRAIKNMG